MSADIGSLRVGQSPQGIRPPALVGQRPAVPATAPIVPQRPVVPATPQPMVIQTAPPAVIVLPESGSGSGRKIIYAILGVLVLGVIIFSLISLFGGSTSEPETAASTTPSPSAEPSSAAASGKTLRTYYGNPTANIDMSERANAINDFRNGFISIQPTAKLATVVGVNSKGSSLTSTAFLDYLLGTTPSSLTAVLGSDWTLLAYGQTEQFDDSGAKTVLSTPKAKTILLIEVSNASGANQSLKEWEQTGLASASAGLLGYDTSKKIVSGFGDGEYRTIPVRYWNFPYADMSIDYAIVTASNNKNYLILSASREAMFFAIDQLMQ